jgi:undecaprenyl-diphosphatase
MKKIRFILGLTIAIILTLIVSLNDVIIIKFIESLRNYYLDYILLSITFASNTFIVFFFLTSLFLWKEHKRRWIFPLWLTVFFSAIIGFFLKILVKRPRPFQEGIVSVLQIAFHFMKNNFNTWDFSFPSFQAILVFAALPLLNKEFRKFRYVWIIFACLVGFSRAYFGVHYLSDVLSGAIIGYLIGYSMVLIEEKYKIGLILMKRLRISK